MRLIGAWTMTGQVTLRWAEEKIEWLREMRRWKASAEKEMVNILRRTPSEWRAGTRRVKITAIGGMWTSLSEDIPGWAKTPLSKGWTSWTIPLAEFLAVFDNDRNRIRLHKEDYKGKLERMLTKQQGAVDKMIKYSETVEYRMTELERHAGITTSVPVPGPVLPRVPV